MSKKKKITGPKVQIQDHLASINAIKAKFSLLKKIRGQIAQLKVLYSQHDNLMAELLPLFVTVEPERFTVKREITLGDQKYKLSPYFYDEKKGKVVAKVWKSTAFESAAIE